MLTNDYTVDKVYDMTQSEPHNICATCQTVHTAGAVVAIGRFDPTGPQGYRTRLGGPIRATRAEADRDLCAERRDLATEGSNE